MGVSLRAERSVPDRSVRRQSSGLRQSEATTGAWAEQQDSVPLFFLREALANPGASDLDINAILLESKIDPAILQEDHAEITAEQFGLFWRTYARATNDEFFGQDSRGLPVGSFVLLCHTVLSAPTLERAMLRMVRFYHVLLSDFDAELIRDGDDAVLVLREDGPPRSAFAYAIFLFVLLGVSHWLIDRRIPLHCVEFRASQPMGVEQYRRLLGDDIKFDCPQTRIRFSADFLGLRPSRNETQMQAFRQDSPKSLLAQYRCRDSVSARVWQELRGTAPAEWPGFEDLAARMYTTSSTLRRRLEAGGTSYQRIKDEVRREWAIEQLRLNKMSNAEIAEELGFGDPSTFYRAFRKWTGATPNAFRRPVRAVT